MRQITLLLLTLALAIAHQPAYAQINIDVAKVTCEQFLLYQVASGRDITIWLSGYYSGQGNTTNVNTGKLRNDYDLLKQSCRRNLKSPVFEIAREVLSHE